MNLLSHISLIVNFELSRSYLVFEYFYWWLALWEFFDFHVLDTQHQFTGRESDWGFTSFMPLSELYDPSRGYLVNDTVIVEADVAVRRVVDYWSHDSKKETGYVGLKNQGATCYMNSLLQTLYHIPYFRKVSIYIFPSLKSFHKMTNSNPCFRQCIICQQLRMTIHLGAYL